MSEKRRTVLSLKVTAELRQTVELLAAHFTTKRRERHTMTDVLEEAIKDLAKREGVK